MAVDFRSYVQAAEAMGALLALVRRSTVGVERQCSQEVSIFISCILLDLARS